MRPPHTSALRVRLRDTLASLYARVLLSLVSVSIALAVVLTIVLTDAASSSLKSQAGAAKAAAARSLGHSVTAWLDYRTQDARSLAGEIGEYGGGAPVLAGHLRRFAEFRSAWLYDRSGHLLHSIAATRTPDVAGTSWFADALNGGEGVSPVSASTGKPALYVTAPAGAGRVLVVAAPTASLSALVSGISPGRTGEALLVDDSHRLIVSSRAGDAPLVTLVDTTAALRGLSGQSGSLVYVDYRGHQVIGGYAPIGALHWGVIIKQDTSVAFAAVHRQRELALILILAGIVVSLLLAALVARALSRPLAELEHVAAAVSDGDLGARVAPSGTTENRRVGASFNAMVSNLESLLGTMRDAGEEVTSSSAELSAAAEQLATATNEQSSASAETSATMEELARTSAAIAEHADGVAERCVATQDTLREAEAGMRASSERTMALAKQVDEISEILELINSIADKTAVLSLNAAIEAARAGESGAGFTVVSEEVGRLAERSKSSASHIAEIVRAAQQDATATVMAMDAGGKQMRQGLELMEEVTTAASQVQLTTQQQRTATVQVVDTMAQLSESARQTSATTQQIAQSAANMSGLAGELRRESARARASEAERRRTGAGAAGAGAREPRRATSERPAAIGSRFDAVAWPSPYDDSPDFGDADAGDPVGAGPPETSNAGGRSNGRSGGRSNGRNGDARS